MDLLTNSFTHVWYILKTILNDIEHSLKYKFKYKAYSEANCWYDFFLSKTLSKADACKRTLRNDTIESKFEERDGGKIRGK